MAPATRVEWSDRRKALEDSVKHFDHDMLVYLLAKAMDLMKIDLEGLSCWQHMGYWRERIESIEVLSLHPRIQVPCAGLDQARIILIGRADPLVIE